MIIINVMDCHLLGFRVLRERGSDDYPSCHLPCFVSLRFGWVSYIYRSLLWIFNGRLFHIDFGLPESGGVFEGAGEG